MNKKYLSLIILTILIIIPLWYYFIVFLPQNADRKFQAEREYKCFEIANNEKAKQEKESAMGECLEEFNLAGSPRP